MIGDAANLASRIEGLTKAYGLQNLIGEKTAQGLKGFAVLEMDIVNVVGRTTPEPIHAILGGKEIVSGPDFSMLKKRHNAFLEAYRGQSWDEAISTARVLNGTAEPFGLDKYYEMMISRIEQFKRSPPPSDWGGIYHATSK